MIYGEQGDADGNEDNPRRAADLQYRAATVITTVPMTPTSVARPTFTPLR